MDGRARDAMARKTAQIEFQRPLLVEAGAGTGKTTTLVARVLAWVMGPGWSQIEGRLRERARFRPGAPEPEPDRIAARVMGGVVAITFTEAAAAEMAARVGEGLSVIEDGRVPRGLDPDLLPTDPELRRGRARALLGALDQLVVRTIHAFCRRLLVTWPLEAGLHPRFEIDADGEQLRSLCRELVEGRLKELYSEPGDAAALALASAGFGPQELATALEALAREAVPAHALDDDPLSPEHIRPLLARLEGHAELVRDLLAPRLGAVRKDRVKSALAIVASLDALLERLGAAGLPAIEELQLWTAELFPENLEKHLSSWARGELGQTEREALDHIEPELRVEARALHRLLRHVTRLKPALLTLARAALGPLLHELERMLRSRGVETFSAMLRDARDLLRARPDVTRRLRLEIDQLLVDEFQDTDRIQCDVVRLISLEGPPEERPGLFLVGDPKQSIYGWRSADLRAYQDFADLVLQHGGQHLSLVVNYRSAPVILEEVAAVHERAMRPEEGVQPPFVPLLPGENTMNNPGFGPEPWAPVEYWVSWTPDPSGDGPAKKTRSTEAIEREAQALARDLLALHRQRGLSWKQAAVLLRSTGHLDVVLSALRDANIPYAVERDKSYYRRREIIDAAAFVRCILDPNDHLALLTVLRSPAVGVPDAALIPLWSQGLPGQMSELFGPDPERLEAIARSVRQAARELPIEVPGLHALSGWEQSLIAAALGIAELRESLEHLPADAWVERLRARFLLEATEAARYQGHYRLANLERFFRTLTEALERDGGDPQALLRSLRRSVAESREAEEGRPKETAGDAVQVMTIHKSKGLDFDHVYVLQTHKEDQERDRTLTQAAAWDAEGSGRGERWEYRLFGAPTLGWDHVEARTARVSQAERVRTLYVAMTRAKERLVLAGDLPWEEVDAERADTHARLLSLRGLPDLAGHMRILGRTEADRVQESGASWAFLGLQTAPLEPISSSARGAGRVVDPEEVARHQQALVAARARAEALEKRPLGTVAAAETHELLRASVAERRFADDRAGDEGMGAGGGDPLELAERLELAVGSAIHRALETLDLESSLEDETERQRGRLAGYLRALVGPDDLPKAEARARDLLERLAEGPLLERIFTLGPSVLARALPVLLPAEAAGAEEPRPVGFVTGTMDLLYREPEGGLVVVDYRLEPTPADPSALEEGARGLAAQGRIYQDALEAALGARPRLELWYLRSGEILSFV